MLFHLRNDFVYHIDNDAALFVLIFQAQSAGCTATNGLVVHVNDFKINSVFLKFCPNQG